MKKYILIAGVNGAGKSTLYESLQTLHDIPRVNADIAKERVAGRIKHGGHGIAKQDIERRFIETLNKKKKVLPESDLAAFYDNTIEFRRFAIYKNGNPVRISHNVPNWYKKFAGDME